MASPRWKLFNSAQYYELHGPGPRSNYDTEEAFDPNRGGRTHLLGDQINVQGIPSAVSPSHTPSRPLLGKPSTKKRVHILDVLAAGLSFTCLALAITVVANESVSWRLSLIYQLILVGFLLSIMNLSLGSVAPTLFLLLEARYGSSTLQNYEGIIRNKILSSRLSFVWRLVLGLMLALPLGLSAAYKRFTGGESGMKVNAAAYIGNASYYGMFAPPGLQSLGQNTGVSLFADWTLPFTVATSPQNGSPQKSSEPPLPMHPQAYGFNVLLLNNESTAILDIPQPDYVSSVQNLLAGGESWNLTAPVIATVATYNYSKTKDPATYESYLVSFCEAAEDSSGAYTHMSMMNDWAVELLDHASPGDQSLQYIGLTPDPGIDYTPSCSNFSQYAYLYDINRQLCKGTWSITRGGIQLVDGSCNGTILPPEKQLVITDNTLFLGVWYMSSLVEFLGPFATARNGSNWMSPYMATGMAAMLWSRITVLADSKPGRRFHGSTSDEDAGLVYPVSDTVVYIRPTLLKSSLLFCVFAIQPLLTVLVLGLILVFHSTPLDKGFGMISILSGVERGSLDVLEGAALSGELTRSVRLVMRPIQDDQKGAIKYKVTRASKAPTHNGKLIPKVLYH